MSGADPAPRPQRLALGPARGPVPMLGLACHWGTRPEQAWSGTPWRLRAALRDDRGLAGPFDLDVTPPELERRVLTLACARRRNGWTSYWKHSRAFTAHVERHVRRLAARSPCDVVIEVGDLGVIDRPYFVLQDLSFDLVLEHVDAAGTAPHFRALDVDRLRRLRDRQHAVLERATGVLAMSRWLASSLVTTTGLPAEKVFVVHPGVVPDARPVPGDRPDRTRKNLLFVGRDFETKGGELVVRALALVRRERPEVTLTVAGPPRWPLDGAVPPGVRFVGPVPAAEVTTLYDTHDLLVMPSRLEGFGMVFAEAMGRGVPCIGRRACAMPEIITPGVTGALVDSAEPAELAATILDALADDGLAERCLANREVVAGRFSWPRAAAETAAAVRSVLDR